MRKVSICFLLLTLALTPSVGAQDLPKLTKTMHSLFLETGYSCRRASDLEGRIEYVGRGGTTALIQLDYRLLPKSGGVVFTSAGDYDQAEAGLMIIFAVMQVRLGKTQVFEPKNYASKIRNLRSAIITSLKHVNKTEFRFDDLDVRAQKFPDEKAIGIVFVYPSW